MELNTPAWLVDAEKLRSLLDDLGAALRRPPSMRGSLDPLALASDTSALAQGIVEVADAARDVQPGIREALTSTLPVVPDRAHAERLATLVHELSGLWRVRVTMGLRPRRVPTLQALLREPGADLLGIFRKEDDENAHSDVLRWLLDPREAPTIAPVALRAVMSRLEKSHRWHQALDAALERGCVCVRREVMLGRDVDDDDNRARIDLVVSGPGFVLGIENKVWASEHDEQTRSYAVSLSELPNALLTGGIFLSPNGSPASSPTFAPLSYLELSACLVEAAVERDLPSAERQVLSGYIKTLAKRVLRAEFHAVLENGGI